MMKIGDMAFSRPAAVLGFGGVCAALGLLAGGGQAIGLHAPRYHLIGEAELAIQLHLAAALAAFVIGAVLLIGRKGVAAHRILGWCWALAMGTTAISSLFIHEIRPGGFSLIHLLSGWVIIALPAALYAARRHRVALHRRAMSGLYFGGMFLAGGFAFLPSRLLGQVFFS